MINTAARDKLQEDLRLKKLITSISGSQAKRENGSISLELKLPEEETKNTAEQVGILTQISKKSGLIAVAIDTLIETVKKLQNNTFLVRGKVEIINPQPSSIQSSDLFIIQAGLKAIEDKLSQIKFNPVVQVPQTKIDLKELKILSDKLDNLKIEVPAPNSDISEAVEGLEKQISKLVELESNRVSYRPTPVTNVSINALRGIVKTTATTVSASAQPIVSTTLANRRSVRFYNASNSETVYWGGADVTTSNGIPVGPGAHSDAIDAGENMNIYVVSANAAEIRVVEVSNDAVGK